MARSAHRYGFGIQELKLKILARLMLGAMVTVSGVALADPAPKAVYILAGHVLTRPGEASRGATTIVIRGDRIAELVDGLHAPADGSRVIDLRTAYVLPGLIDAHVHLWGIAGDPERAQLLQLSRDRFDDMVEAQTNARLDIEAGFTTVRDLEADPRGIRALRDAIDDGDIEGPTIVNAGAMISVTGGHADYSAGLAEVYADAVRPRSTNICDGADDCRRAVREQVALGAEVIKFAATGGVLSNVAGGLGRQMTFEEMKAIVDTAHSFGRKVAAHSHAADGTKTAILAGVDSIEHGTFLDDEAIRLFKANGTYLVPTMLAPVTALEQAHAGQLPPAMVPKAEQVSAVAMDSHRGAIAAGVKIAFGTDTGVSKHGQNAREFALLVDAGMSPLSAIRAATVSAADLLGRSKDIGSIETGKYADIIAVAGDPTKDVTRLEHVDYVMRHGVIIKENGKRMPFPPE
jgi:imidazolonepropionase-like amidohydrolase